MKIKHTIFLIFAIAFGAFTSINAQLPEQVSFSISGQIHYNDVIENINQPSLNGEFDFHKISVKGGYKFNEALSFNTNLKIEHAFDKAYDNGDFFFSKMYLDYKTSNNLSFQAGMISTPLTTTKSKPYGGVETALFDKLITLGWRELGVGVKGKINPKISYKATVSTGLTPTELSKKKGIYAAKNSKFTSSLENIAVGAHLNYQLDDHFKFGTSALISTLDSKSNYGDTFEGANYKVLEAYLVYKYKGLGSRIVGGYSKLKGIEDINRVLGSEVGESQVGGLFELQYNLYTHPSFENIRGNALYLFSTAEIIDTQFTTKTVYNDPASRRTNYTIGFIYSPIAQFTFKADYQIAHVATQGKANLFNISLGFSL